MQPSIIIERKLLSDRLKYYYYAVRPAWLCSCHYSVTVVTAHSPFTFNFIFFYLFIYYYFYYSVTVANPLSFPDGHVYIYIYTCRERERETLSVFGQYFVDQRGLPPRLYRSCSLGNTEKQKKKNNFSGGSDSTRAIPPNFHYIKHGKNTGRVFRFRPRWSSLRRDYFPAAFFFFAVFVFVLVLPYI